MVLPEKVSFLYSINFKDTDTKINICNGFKPLTPKKNITNINFGFSIFKIDTVQYFTTEKQYNN